MSVAYLDSSVLVAIGLAEEDWESVARRLRGFEHLISSDLLEAEVRSAFLREEATPPDPLLVDVRRIMPDRPLQPEISRVLELGYLRGADVWHLAVALSTREDPGEITFLTLDGRQGAVAEELGFQT